MSAIDWLTDSVAIEPAAEAPASDVSSGSEVEIIQVRPLGGPSIDGIGVIAPDELGFGTDLWGPSDVPRLVGLIARERVDALPAVRDLLVRFLLLQTEPPETSTEDGLLFLARVDKLLELGALDHASALLAQSDLGDPRMFRRWFDISLLMGTETKACEVLATSPDLAPTFPTRIFCLARGGDWDAAALSLDSAEALGVITPQEDALLLRFLDESTADEDGALPLPRRVTPLAFRLFEAVGEPISTDGLPRAFAHADLRPINGWKARLIASERLASVGAISPKQMFDLYALQQPSASGGVWDRTAAIQNFERSISDGDAGAAVTNMIPAWNAMQVAELEVAFARRYASSLDALEITPTELSQKIAILASANSPTAQNAQNSNPQSVFLTALAQGRPNSAAASNATEGWVQQGFSSQALPPALQNLVNEGRIGEAVLQATLLFTNGALGDAEDLINSLRLLRALGLEQTARQAALELLILERRG